MKNYQCPVILKNGNQCSKKRVRDKKGRLLGRCKTHYGKRGMPVVNGFFETLARQLTGEEGLGANIKKYTPPGSIRNPVTKNEYLNILDNFFQFYNRNGLEINGVLGAKEISEIINEISPGFLKKIIQDEIKKIPILVQDTKSIISKKLPENPVMKFKNLTELKGVMTRMKPEDGITLLTNIDRYVLVSKNKTRSTKESKEVFDELDELRTSYSNKYKSFSSQYAPYQLSRQEFEKNRNKNPFEYGLTKKENLKKKQEKENWWDQISYSDSESESSSPRAQVTPRRRVPLTPQSDIMSLYGSSDEE